MQINYDIDNAPNGPPAPVGSALPKLFPCTYQERCSEFNSKPTTSAQELYHRTTGE